MNRETSSAAGSGDAHTGNGRPRKAAPLHPLVGNLWVPVWAIRPGAYEALRPYAAEMPLWLAIHSRSSDYSLPCYATRQQLGDTIGVSVRTVTRQLKALQTAGLLLELDRGIEAKTRRHRPPARWALCPFQMDQWSERVTQAIEAIAEEDGQSRYWYDRSLRQLERFAGASAALRSTIADDMPFVPKAPKKKGRKAKRVKKMRG